jgi:two-component system OmpR family sensor kinase
MMQSRRPLAQSLIQRLCLIAGAIVLLNAVLVGAYYGSDRRALELEAVANLADRVAEQLDAGALPDHAPVRALFRDQPEAYAFALVDRTGTVLDSMNRALIPPSALDLFADDWITTFEQPTGRVLYAGHEFHGRDDGLRLVFVMFADPAGLLWQALGDELLHHVWIPTIPMALLLIMAGAVLIHRELAPLAIAANWARAVRPGAIPPLPTGTLPAEAAEMVTATMRALDRLDEALSAEARHSAEAAHALRTPVAVLMARLDALPPGATTELLRSDVSALARTVQQVLAAARADRLTVVETASVDLREPVRDVTADLAPFAYARGVEIELVEPKTEVLVKASREGVQIALTNLIENAVVHGGPGRVEIVVGPGPTVSVRDRGPGMPTASDRAPLAPFWRGPDAPAGGTGLGLAIIDRLQRAQGGAVELETPQDGGCNVRLIYQPAAARKAPSGPRQPVQG